MVSISAEENLILILNELNRKMQVYLAFKIERNITSYMLR